MVYGIQNSQFSQVLAKTILRLKSWKLEVQMPASPKFILIGAPHTSNWDFIYALLLGHAAGIKLHWVGKDSLFRFPFGGLMRRLGGIPVNRATRNNFVQQIIDTFNRVEQLVIAMAPEGTRGKVDHWKTGFYYIALGAKIPIAMGYIDYHRKVVGIGPTLYPSGDIHNDFIQFENFYRSVTGKHPQLHGDIGLRT